jgi:DNA-directed RNA polymerase subunit RPC12/RpoP
VENPKAENPIAATGAQPRIYGCAKCGTPFTAYPPDDIHTTSSRQSSSFLETVETSLACPKCNEVTRLYWGRRVFYRGIVVGAQRLSALIALIVQRLLKVRIGKGKDAKKDSEMPEEYSDSGENIDDKIYEYIMSKGGAIGIRSASEDLGVPAEAIKEAIERMTMEGRLKA